MTDDSLRQEIKFNSFLSTYRITMLFVMRFLANKKYYKFIYSAIDQVSTMIIKICPRRYSDFGIRKLVLLSVTAIHTTNNKLPIKLWTIYVTF